MPDESVDALATALTADPPRPVATEALVAADPDELADALQRAVADLPPTEQRTRLASAFRTISASVPETVLPATTATVPRPSKALTRSALSMRPFTPARAGLLTAVFVVSLLGGILAGAATDSDSGAHPETSAGSDSDAHPETSAGSDAESDPETGAGTNGSDDDTRVATAAADPVPVLTPIATSEEPPSSRLVAGFLPPDQEVQSNATRDALENRSDELGDDADGIVPDTAMSPGDDDAIGLVGGYADGSAVFGDSTTVDEGDADGSGADGGGGDAEGDETPASPGAPGDGARASTEDTELSGSTGTDAGGGSEPSGSEPLGLIDICASDAPPGDCDGVGGTVDLATVPAFRFVTEPKAVVYWPGCVGRRDLHPDEFLIMLATNNLGAFTARYRIAGTDAAFTEVAGESPEIWREALDSGDFGAVNTCLAADRPDDADALSLEVEITGVGAQDSGTARFTGTLDLPGAPDAPPEPERREGRPPVTVTALTANTLQVTVPVGPDEHTEVVLVPRERTGSGEECVDPDPRTITEASSTDRVTVRRPGEITLMADWTDRDFRVSAPRAGAYSVCVAWFDDGDPPRNLERASIPVEIAGVTRGDVLLAGWQQPNDGGAQPDELTVSVRIDEDCTPGRATIADPSGEPAPDKASAQVLCSFDSAPGYVGIITDPVYGDGDPLTQRALLAVPEGCGSPEVRDRWDSRMDGTCTTWYVQAIKRPDSAVAGAIVVGIRLSGGGSGGATIGDEQAELTDADEIDGPRLRWGRVSAEPDPSNPARRAIVTWATDVPARVEVEATPEAATAECRAKSASLSDLRREGSATIGGLCPGISYYVSFDVTGSDGRTVYDAWNARTYLPTSVGIVRRSARLTMDPLSVTFDYQLTFEETLRGETVNQGVVPTRMNLEFPWNATGGRSHSHDYSQYFDGRARFGLDCSNPSHFNRSRSGVELSLRGGEFHLAESMFHFETYYPLRRGIFDGGPGRRCPTLYNQTNQTRTDPLRGCPVRVSHLEPVGDTNSVDSMLSGGTAEFAAWVPMCSSSGLRRFNVMLTVQMREVRTLRGS